MLFCLVLLCFFTSIANAEVHLGPTGAVEEVAEELDEKVKKHYLNMLFQESACRSTNPLEQAIPPSGCSISQETWEEWNINPCNFLEVLMNLGRIRSRFGSIGNFIEYVGMEKLKSCYSIDSIKEFLDSFGGGGGGSNPEILEPAISTNSSTVNPGQTMEGDTDNVQVSLVIRGLHLVGSDSHDVSVRLRNYADGTSGHVIEGAMLDEGDINSSGVATILVSGGAFEEVKAPSAANSPYVVEAKVEFKNEDLDKISWTQIGVIQVNLPEPVLNPSRSSLNPHNVVQGQSNSYTGTVYLENAGAVTSNKNEVTVRLVDYDDGVSTDIIETETFDAGDITDGDTVKVDVSGTEFSNVIAPNSDYSPYHVEADVTFSDSKLGKITNKKIDDISVISAEPKVNPTNSSIVAGPSNPVVEGCTNVYDATVSLEDLDAVESDNNEVTVKLINYEDGTSEDITKTVFFDEAQIQSDDTLVLSDITFKNIENPTASNSPYDVNVDIRFTDDYLSDIQGATIDQINVSSGPFPGC